MTISLDIFAAIFILVLVISVIFFIMKPSRMKTGMSSGVLGASFNLHTSDQQKAIEAIVEQKSDNKQEEQDSGAKEIPGED